MKLLVMVMLWCSVGFGQELPRSIILTWDRPVAREDTTPLTPQEIAAYRIEVRLSPDTTPYLVRDVPGLLNESDGPLYVLGELAIIMAGRNCFRIRTIDVNDLESRWSDELCLDIVLPDEFEIIIDIGVR